MELSKLRKDLRKKCLALRSIDRIIHSDKFAEAYLMTKEHTEIHAAIANGNVDFVFQWVEKTLVENLHISELSLRELRKKAAQYMIPRYNLLTKDELLQTLVQIMETERVANLQSDFIQSESNESILAELVGNG